MKIAYFTVTGQGRQLAGKLAEKLPGIIIETDVKEKIKNMWETCDALVFIMAAGIVVRYIAPLLIGKDKDPAVVVMDIEGVFAVSLLSGHLGGANELAGKLADISGGTPVITTATDTLGISAFDMIAKENNMFIENLHKLKIVSGALVAGAAVNVYASLPVSGKFKGNVRLVENLLQEELMTQPLVVIDALERHENTSALYLRPRTLILGVGCKKNTEPEKLLDAFEQFCEAYNVKPECIKVLATIDMKAEEPAILKLVKQLNVPLKVIDRAEIDALDFNSVAGGAIKPSPFVAAVTGVGSVSEASAYLAAKSGRMRIPKTKYSGITFAVAEEMKIVKL